MKSELVQKIEVLRKQMVDAAIQLGFTHTTTVSISQKLDSYLNILEQKRISK